MTKVCPEYDQRTPKVHWNYDHSMSEVCIKYAQSIQIGRSDSNQVLSNSTLTRSNSRTSPYQALLCPKIIINKLIGRAANCTIHISVLFIPNSMQFHFLYKPMFHWVSSTLKAVSAMNWSNLENLTKGVKNRMDYSWPNPHPPQGGKTKACFRAVTAILPLNSLIDRQYAFV